MNNTKIEWCDSTWNPVTGCLHNCEYCYARKIATRFGTLGKVLESAWEEGVDLDPVYFTNPDYFAELNEPVRDENNRIEPYPYNFYPTLHRYRLGEPAQKTRPHTIFVCSMADLFGEWVPDEWIEEVFTACEKAPHHRYLFLTKNFERYIELYDKGKLPDKPNMWYGITLDTFRPFRDRYVDIEFSDLTACRNFFVSVEPLLGDIASGAAWNMICFDKGIKWAIIGAETGTRKNKVVPPKSWVDNIVWDCDLFNIPVFMKDSLLPIVGEENMRREFPWKSELLNATGDDIGNAAQDVLAPA